MEHGELCLLPILAESLVVAREFFSQRPWVSRARKWALVVVERRFLDVSLHETGPCALRRKDMQMRPCRAAVDVQRNCVVETRSIWSDD